MRYRLSSLPLLIFLVSILMSSCREPKELEYRDFKNLSSEKLGFAASVFSIDLVYYNPNNFGLDLKRTDLDIYIDNNFLGHTSQDFQIHIPKREEFTLPLKISVDMKNAYKNAMPALFGKEVVVKITGTVKVGKANIYKSFKVDYEGKQKFSL
jgi:LEA14-like dessication related protein